MKMAVQKKHKIVLSLLSLLVIVVLLYLLSPSSRGPIPWETKTIMKEIEAIGGHATSGTQRHVQAILFENENINDSDILRILGMLKNENATKYIKRMYIASPLITDNSVCQMTGFDRLQELHLNGIKITGNNFEHFFDSGSIEYVHIQKTSIDRSTYRKWFPLVKNTTVFYTNDGLYVVKHGEIVRAP